jgi:gluconate 2-dehydrogenase subunit 3-like protein
MDSTIAWKDDVYVLNYCTKYLARDSADPRHNFGQYPQGDPRAAIAEAWRFPVIDSYFDGTSYEDSYRFNFVTFVYKHAPGATAAKLGVIGTFAQLYQPIPMRRVGDSLYSALSVVVPKGRSFHYRFVLDGQSFPDPVNPQHVTLLNGALWSRFFTQMCTEVLCFERWEMDLLNRLTNHILPFRTTEGQRFVDQFISGLDRSDKDQQYLHAYRLEQPVGAANFIDKILAKEEAHHLTDYRICLELIDQLLRRRNPAIEPAAMPLSVFDDLYDQLSNADHAQIEDWDYARYGNPRYFLQLLRRHVYTGAFTHPKYGGNLGGAGWSYLEQLTRDTAGQTHFDWRRGQEPPLGTSHEYRG